MAVFIPMPTTREVDFERTTALDGTDFVIRLRWLERTNAWVLDLYTDDRTELLTGSVLRPNQGLLRRHTSANGALPPGELVAVTKAETIGIDDLGSTAVLWYVTGAELASGLLDL